jgi:excisionase family DNA binding protein
MRKEYITVRDVGRALDRSKDWVYRHIWAGNLKAILVGNQYIIAREDFEEFKRWFYESQKKKKDREK